MPRPEFEQGRRAALAAAAAGTLGAVVPAWAQTSRYPARAIRVVIPFGAGGTIDSLCRHAMEQLGKELGQAVYLDSRPGANGVLGTSLVASAAPDGHTLLLVTGSFVVNPAIYRKLPYDPVRDLLPITALARAIGLVLVAHPGLPVNSVQDLIALAGRSDLNYSSPGVGNTIHLCTELFKQRTGARLMHVPYKGSAAALSAVVANEVHVEFTPPALAAPFIKAGKLKLLATTAPRRLAEFPEAPTMAESEVKDMVFEGSWIGLFCPSATPREVVERLHTTIAALLKRPSVRESIESNGSGYLVDGRSPADFGRQVRADFARFAEAVKLAGIEPE